MFRCTSNISKFSIQTDCKGTSILLPNNLKRAISDYKRVLHGGIFDSEEFADEIMEAPLSEPFFTKRIKILSRPDGFMLYGKLGADLFSSFELLYPFMKVKLRLIKARPIFYMIFDNPNVSLRTVDCSFALLSWYWSQGFLWRKRMEMLAYTSVDYNYVEPLAKTIILPAKQNRFLQENFLNKAAIGPVAIRININSAFTGSYTENSPGISTSTSDKLEYSEEVS